MAKEIYAKTLLSRNSQPNSWFGTNYIFNIYRGCEHHCIYCDSRSLCYQIENFDSLTVKINSIQLLDKELKSKRKKVLLGTGSMSDPYTPSEKKYKLTRGCLKTIAYYKFPTHITTKSNLILRDVDLLQEINKTYASVAMTITTCDEKLAKILEPSAPPPSERFKTLKILSKLNICTSITLMPILPFIEDTEENIRNIITKANYFGVKHIIPCLGMSLRDRQRDYYYKCLDSSFPGMRKKYEQSFGNNYMCFCENYKKLNYILRELCDKYNISLKMPHYEKRVTQFQLDFFSDLNNL